MELETLKSLIADDLSQREIGERLGIGQTTLRYWLDKFELKTRKNKFNSKETKPGYKWCSKCNKEKKFGLFYPGSGYCKVCHKDSCLKRLQDSKLRMLAYKGNKCEVCDLKLEEACPSVFEFHHKDPKTKDPKFSHNKSLKWEKIILELDKCMLVCANCHRIIHYKLNITGHISVGRELS